MSRQVWLFPIIAGAIGLAGVEIAGAQVARDRATMVRPQLAEIKPSVVNPRTMQMVSPFVYGLRKEITDNSGQGPNFDKPVPLVDTISTSRSIDLELNDILNIFPDVYPDRNPNSGLFYFLPRLYRLDWEADQGYGMRMMYNAAAKEGQAGDVLITARLTAAVDASEIQLARDLLVATGQKVTALRAVPLAGPPEVSLSGGLKALFNIPPEKISSNPTSEALGEIDIAWVTDSVTKENIELALTEQVGISGGLTFTSAGAVPRKTQIPIKITIADADTLGRFRWTRDQNWRNTAPYPLRLKYLHALILKDNKTPIIYSWGLGGTDVVPTAQVQWDAKRIPSWVEKEAKRIWIDYAVLPGCDACDKQVVSSITSGVSNIKASTIVFETITPLADTGAYKLLISVKSSYLNPRSHDAQVLPDLSLGKDEQEYQSGAVYLSDRSQTTPDGSDPIFEYLLSVVMRDGTTHQASRWVPSQNLRVLIGSAQIKAALGFVPGKEAPKP